MDSIIGQQTLQLEQGYGTRIRPVYGSVMQAINQKTRAVGELTIVNSGIQSVKCSNNSKTRNDNSLDCMSGTGFNMHIYGNEITIQ